MGDQNYHWKITMTQNSSSEKRDKNEGAWNHLVNLWVTGFMEAKKTAWILKKWTVRIIGASNKINTQILGRNICILHHVPKWRKYGIHRSSIFSKRKKASKVFNSMILWKIEIPNGK